MENQTITISKGQYLRDVLPEIPNKCILDKCLPGIGGSTLELEANRPSILVEPSVPVILSKKERYRSGVLAVYGGTKTDDIRSYFQDCIKEGIHPKVLSTPESLWRVINVCQRIGYDIYNEAFLLVDEIHMISESQGYRKSILEVIDPMFQDFRQKAVMSASMPEMSDSRFEEQGFTRITVQPDFEWRTNLRMITTNNVCQAFKEELASRMDDAKPVFMFSISIQIGVEIARGLDMMDDITFFCSPESECKVRSMGIGRVETEWNAETEAKLSRINILTSRFFCGFDLDLSYQPRVFMLTVCNVVEYTMLNPSTDLRQILGRFRGGILSATFICDVNPEHKLCTREMALGMVDAHRQTKDTLTAMMEGATDEFLAEALRQTIARMPYQDFLDDYGEESYFAIDSFIMDLMLKSAYRSAESIHQAVEETGAFIVEYEHREYKLCDKDIISMKESSRYIRQERERLANLLEAVYPLETESDYEMRDLLCRKDPWLVDVYEELGLETLAYYGFAYRPINHAYIISKAKHTMYSGAVCDLVRNDFNVGQWYSSKELRERFRKMYDEMGIPEGKRAKGTNIHNFFDVQEKWQNNERGFVLLRSKI